MDDCELEQVCDAYAEDIAELRGENVRLRSLLEWLLVYQTDEVIIGNIKAELLRTAPPLDR